MIIYDLLRGNSFARSFIGSFMVLLRILGMAGECWGHLGPEFCRQAPGYPWLATTLTLHEVFPTPVLVCTPQRQLFTGSQIAHSVDRKCNHVSLMTFDALTKRHVK